jgi:glycosyltransferase involved in cell wall biosynthesis
MRIGYVMQNGVPDLSTVSGPQLHVVSVIRGLQQRGHTVRTVAPQGGRLQWSDDLSEWHPAQFTFSFSSWFRAVERPLRRLQRELHLPFIGMFDSIRYADAASHHLRGFDVVYERHGHMGYGGILAARRLGVPAIVELNGNILKELDAQGIAMSRLQREVSRQVTVRTFGAADRMVAVSPALRDELVLHLGVAAERVVVVENGADLELFRRPIDASAARQAYGLGKGPLVCFAGSFEVWHGVDLLVRAFRSVRNRCPAARLVLVGDGQARAAVESQVATLGLGDSVAFLGHRPHAGVADVVGASDVLVAPYPVQQDDFLGTPLKLVEYMAAGKAIVASRARTHDLIVEGVTGLRVPGADADALADAIVRLLGDAGLRATLGAAAAREALVHSWDRVVDELVAILSSVVADRHRLRIGP